MGLCDVVQRLVDEPVLAAGPFHGTGSLPGELLIAVTPTRVHAFERASAGGDPAAGRELAAWDRAGLRVTAAGGAGFALERAAGGERVVCSTAGDELALSVVRALLEPAGEALF
jgi:hypothetical protein